MALGPAKQFGPPSNQDLANIDCLLRCPPGKHRTGLHNLTLPAFQQIIDKVRSFDLACSSAGLPDAAGAMSATLSGITAPKVGFITLDLGPIDESSLKAAPQHMGLLPRLSGQPSGERRATAIIPVPVVAPDDVLVIRVNFDLTLQAPREHTATIQRNSHHAAVIGPDVERVPHDFALCCGISPRIDQYINGLTQDFLESRIQTRRSASGQRSCSKNNSDYSDFSHVTFSGSGLGQLNRCPVFLAGSHFTARTPQRARGIPA